MLNTQHYKLRIKNKVEQSRERSSAPPGVVTIEKGAFSLLSTTVSQLTYIWCALIVSQISKLKGYLSVLFCVFGLP